ncbi:MAG: hypothetical protein RQ867_00420 [Mariprofundaceae bacterium]|nr:hypothetical protein [Mariprofundaceae bacterium]
MKKIPVRNMLFALAATVALGIVPAQADDETTYGRELMTEQERAEHRQKMRSLEGEEREAYRKEQHERMEKRAEERGTKIPDEPAERGQGMRQGMGGGQQGQGMGGGRGGQGMGQRGR